MLLVWSSNLWACICSAYCMIYAVNNLAWGLLVGVVSGKQEDLLGVLCLTSCRIRLSYLFTELCTFAWSW
jgi:hypothetical protein